MAPLVDRVRSADGTEITYERSGGGPLVVVVGGALSDRSSFTRLARRLAGSASVVCYDRRGRGDSGDRAPHRVRDEVDDLLALCGAVGDPDVLYGHSSGALLALGACAQGLGAGRLCCYEPPFNAGERTGRLGAGFVGHLGALVRAGRRAEAVTAFLTDGTGAAAEDVDRLAGAPSWASMEALAHTLAYDVALCAGPEAIGEEAARAVEVPTLVLAGGDSRGAIRASASELAEQLSDGRLAVLEGEGHVVSSAAIAPVLEGLLDGRAL